MDDISKIKKEALTTLEKIGNSKDLSQFRVTYLGRKGKVPMFLRGIAQLPQAKRREAGSAGNALRMLLEDRVRDAEKRLFHKEAPTVSGAANALDTSRPGKKVSLGHAHILSQTLAETRHIFVSMGFAAVDGPQIESEWYNFDALNIPKDHPARDMQDTFWLRQKEIQNPKSKIQSSDPRTHLLLRTHISGVQVRYMEQHQPPFRIYYDGLAYRRDATDATHDYQFHQFEILYVDKQLSVANFKYIIETFLRRFFKKDVKIRLRPAYFPFVEPGFEIDMTCVRCGGKKCTLCTTGWVEICGAGMVHQNVFRAAGYVPGEWTGIAFAFGVERLAMLKHRIPDIRLFFSGDLRFIEQF